MKKFVGLILSCFISLGLVAQASAKEIALREPAPERTQMQSETFRAGAGQSFYMVTVADCYINRTELVDYQEHKNITFGYSLTNMRPHVRQAMRTFDRYTTYGTLKYAFGGPIDGWDFSVFTDHYYI